MDANKLFQSKLFGGILCGLAILIVMLAAFRAGMAVGFRKADFSCRWGENYHRNFAGPKDGFNGGFDGRDFIDANGVIGQIIKTDSSTIVIAGKDNVEKIILTDDQTKIKTFRGEAKVSDLKVNDFIIVIGEPNQSGQIIARLLRIMPPPPELPANQPLSQSLSGPGTSSPPAASPANLPK